MAKKEIQMDDILTKVSHIFKKDVYIVNHKYFISGEKSQDEIPGPTLVTIDDGIESIKDFYKENNIIYIEDIKKFKAGDKSLLRLVDDEDEIDLINRDLDTIIKLVDEVKSWDNLIIPEEYHETFFNESEHIELFSWDDKIPTLRASKVIFPTITIAKRNEWVYSYRKPDNKYDLNILLFQTLSDFALIQEAIGYIELKR